MKRRYGFLTDRARKFNIFVNVVKLVVDGTAKLGSHVSASSVTLEPFWRSYLVVKIC